MRETSSERGPGRHLISPRSRIHLQCAIAQPPRARVNLIKLVACRATFHWDSSAAVFFILIFDRQRKKFATSRSFFCYFREEIISISKRNLVEVCRARHLSREHDSFDLLFAFIIYDSEFYVAERASTSAVLLTWVVSACPLNGME